MHSGVRNTLRALHPKSIWRRIRIFIDRDMFDILNGTDTAQGVTDKVELFGDCDSSQTQYMVHYGATLTSKINAALDKLVSYDASVQEGTFFDLGSGKGKVLILAERKGFKNIVGVEYSPQLNDVCRKNLQRVGSKHVSIIEGDAANIEIPGGTVVFYIYNAFQGPLLKRVLDNILNSFAKRFRTGYVIYIDPVNFSKNEKFELDPESFELFYADTAELNPFHIYRIKEGSR